MSNLDYIIVGQGIAGSCFALKLIQEGKSFVVIDQPTHQASQIAAGVYNPVVLYRFALIWNADLQMKLMHDYFSKFEQLLNQKYNHTLPTYRIIKDENEIHAWVKKSIQPELATYIDDQIHTETPETIKAPFGFTEVKNTGRIDLYNCLNDFKTYLIQNQKYLPTQFDYEQLEVENNYVKYQHLTANKIVFCDGYGIKENPYFNYLPIIGVKGEVIKIKTQTSLKPAIWKANTFLMPIDDQICYVGSTYQRNDLNYEPTEQGKNEILNGLHEFFDGQYEILEHVAAIRPTVSDRRPVIGHHPNFENVLLLNGMGTRGTLLAPAMTEELFALVEHQTPLSKEANLDRFTKKHFHQS